MTLHDIDDALLAKAGRVAAWVNRRNGLDQWKIAREMMFSGIVVVEISLVLDALLAPHVSQTGFTILFMGLFLWIYHRSMQTITQMSSPAGAMMTRQGEFFSRMFGLGFQIVLLVTMNDVQDILFMVGVLFMEAHSYFKACDPASATRK